MQAPQNFPVSAMRETPLFPSAGRNVMFIRLSLSFAVINEMDKKTPFWSEPQTKRTSMSLLVLKVR